MEKKCIRKKLSKVYYEGEIFKIDSKRRKKTLICQKIMRMIIN
jgi:hypothetical protein